MKQETKDKKKISFYRKIIDDVFSPMQLGQLTMHLYDGDKLVYGYGEGVRAEIFVRNENFFKKCVLFGDVGFGEAYVDGDWDTEDITAVIDWMITNVEDHPTLMADEKKKKPVNFLKLINKAAFAYRKNSLKGSRKNIYDHYDLGNDFFKLFLDPSMTYSSAYFKENDMSLQDAQIAKNDNLCMKLRLCEQDHLLEIGSGWGGMSIHAAKNYGAKVTTVTISQEQHDYAKKRIQEEGLADKIKIELKDYRLLEGQYDKIVSVEMLEAVGHKYMKSYFGQCQKLLSKKHGILALQAILSPCHRYDSFRKNVDWIQKHIFPGSLLPSMSVIQDSISATGNCVLFDFEDLTPDYVKTLATWRENFNKQKEQVNAYGFDEKFMRKWNYYWSYCEAAFKTRNISVAQIVFTRPNNPKLMRAI